MSGAPSPSVNNGLSVASGIESAAPSSFKLDFNKKVNHSVPSPPLPPVQRVVTKESLADASTTVSNSSPVSLPTSESDEHSLFEFSLLSDGKDEESELLSLPLTNVELPQIELSITPPPLESASFESCAATLLTPATESDSSLATAAAIAAQQQPVADIPAPPSLSIKAPPIVSVAPPANSLPVVSPKPRATRQTRARSNSKSTNKKNTNKGNSKRVTRRVSPVLPTPTAASSAPAAAPAERPSIPSQVSSGNNIMAEQQPPQPPSQPTAAAVPTPITVTAPAAVAPRPAAPATTAAAAPQAAAPAPQAAYQATAAAAGGQPLPPGAVAVAARKYAPPPQAYHPPAPASSAAAAAAAAHHAPPQAPQTRPRASSNARNSPSQNTSNTVTNIHPTTGQVENTGRWTAEEHRLFLQGLEQHGKGWKKIATLIKSRTVVQIRTHAQKYFQKLAKARQNGEAVGGGVVVNGAGGVIPMGTAEGDGTIGIAIPVGADGQPVVTMRTTAHPNSTVVAGNMSIGSDPTSLAAAQGQIGIATAAARGGRKRRNAAPSTTKRKAIGSAVRSSVREGRNVKRQKVAAGKRASAKVAPAPAHGVPQAPVAVAGAPVATAVAPAPQAHVPPVPGAQVAVPAPGAVPNPLPAVSNVLDPYVTATIGMPPPPQAPTTAPAPAGTKARGRQQLVQTATHGTLPMAALEDAVFRLLTPATGAPSPMPPPPPQGSTAAAAGIVDPLAPTQPGKVPVAHTQYHPAAPPVAAPAVAAPGTAAYPQGVASNASPTGVADVGLLPSWVDAKNPPGWYNEGGDIDQLLDDADCLNWLSDTGDLEETYPPAVAEPAAVVSSSSTAATVLPSVEPTPVGVTTVVQDPTGGVVHPSTESLSFLVDPPEQHPVAPVAVQAVPAPVAVAQPVVQVGPAPVADATALPTFLEDTTAPPEVPAPVPYASATEAADAAHGLAHGEEAAAGELPEHKLAGVGESDTNLMGFPDLDMGDEQAFVSALLENNGASTMSFPKLNSAGVLGNAPEEPATGEESG